MPPPYEPRSNDLTMQQAADMLQPLMKQGVEAFIKWTCPKCGERCLSDDPLGLEPGTDRVIFALGYVHTERDDGSPCGETVSVYEWRFGCQLHYKLR